MRGPPSFLQRDAPIGDRQRQQHGAGQACDRADRRKPRRIVDRLQRIAHGSQRLARLGHMDHAGGKIESRAKPLRRPFKHRIERLPLALGQRFRLVGAIAEEVGIA